MLEGLFEKKVGEVANRGEVQELAEKLTQALEMVAGLRGKTDLLGKRQKEVEVY